jgi:cold shock protein
MIDTLQFAGALKLWNPRGYGLIERDGDHSDVFIHISLLKLARLVGIEVGARVTFDVSVDKFGRLRASKIARLR